MFAVEYFCPHWPTWRLSFHSLMLRIGVCLHHFLSNCMEQARHCHSSGNNTIISLDDCPKLVSWSLYSYYHGTQNSQNNFMVARWVFSSLRDLDPRNLGYYLYPCMLRTIWRVGCLCQTHCHFYSIAASLAWGFLHFCIHMGLPRSHSGKEPTFQCRRCKRLTFDPWVGRPPGGERGSPLQYSSLENSVDRRAWQSLGLQRFRHDWGCMHQEFYMISSPKVPNCFRSQT